MSKPLLKPPVIDALPELKLQNGEETKHSGDDHQRKENGKDKRSKEDESEGNNIAEESTEEILNVNSNKNVALNETEHKEEFFVHGANENKKEAEISKQSEEDLQESMTICGSRDRIEDGLSAFSVSPKEAVLPAGSNMEFVVTFAPPKVRHNSLTYFLKALNYYNIDCILHCRSLIITMFWS